MSQYAEFKFYVNNERNVNYMPYMNETVSLEMPLVGYAYVPIQQADSRNLFDPEYGLKQGTIFPILNKPLGVYGHQYKGDVIFEDGGM